MSKWASLLLLLMPVALASGQLNDPPASAAPMGPRFEKLGVDQHLGRDVPGDLIFRDEHGETVQLSRYFDGRKPVLLTLVQYRCANLCTVILNDTLRCLRAMPMSAGEDFTVLTVSFDPRETPELAQAKKSQYLSAYRRPGGEQGWHFLTGDQSSIDALTKALGFKYEFDVKSNQFVHPSAIAVLTPHGKISRYFLGLEFPPRDVRLALVEASGGKVGSLADQVILFCYHWDPSQGRYSLAVFRALRIFSAVLLGAIGLFVIKTLRRERRLAV